MYKTIVVPLNKCQEALVPQDGKLFALCTRASFVCVRQADEVEDERVYGFVRERVLFVDEDADEKRVGPRIVHVAETRKGCRRMQ